MSDNICNGDRVKSERLEENGGGEGFANKYPMIVESCGDLTSKCCGSSSSLKQHCFVLAVATQNVCSFSM